MRLPQLYKTTGIILKRTNVGEGDKIISVLCEHIGKKHFIAKGIRKITSRRASHVDLFSKTTLLIHHGKILDSINGATAIQLYGSSYHNLKQMAVAYTACELCDRLIMEGVEHDDVFGLLDTFLNDIHSLHADMLGNRLRMFIEDVLAVMGYMVKEKKFSTLSESIRAVERIIERKIRSEKILSRSGIDLT